MRLKLCLLLVFIITFSWAQTTKTFVTNGTFPVPNGVTSINVSAWGGGGSGGGASGAGLLLGRGAAGGGGGAFASSTLTVTPGATLNVVVAGQTLGASGANGTAGGNSTITGYESLFLAAGGSGGGANNAGGTPVGGIGGTVANSKGTVRFAGTSGGNGSTSLLSLLLSSGAGGAGANAGGAGGASLSSLILGTAPGNAGSSPGGGGGGAINSALGAAQVGGTGAAGQLTISYTCPTYNITSTTATNVCASSGTTSTVTVTSGASSLPVGNYVVTYNRSNPSATALTANLTVSTAGTGVFTAVGLNTVGSSTITVTKITSQTCSSTISSNNTATVIISPATVAGTVTGGTTINAGSTSGLLTLSGHTGTVVKWQSSVSPFTTWVDIANTNTTYTSGTLTATTQFRAVVQSGACAAANSAATTVTVVPLPTITGLAASNVCTSATAQSTALSYSATTGSPITYSIVWNSSPANSFAAVTDAALPSSPITIAVPAGAAAGTYTGTLTVKNANGGISTGSIFTVTINETPTITSDGVFSLICANGSSQIATLFYIASSGNPTSYAIDWNSTANAAFLPDIPDIPNVFDPTGSKIEIEIPANVLPGTYNGSLIVKNGSCSSAYPVTITIIEQAVGGTVTGGTTINSGETSGLLTLSGHTGTVVKWQSSVSPFTTWVDIANTDTTYTSEVLTETTQFRAVVRNGFCPVVNSAATTVTVEALPTVDVIAVTSVCSSTAEQETDLIYETTGSPLTYSIVWDSSPANNFAAVIDEQLFGGTLPIIHITVPAGTAAGTYTGTLTVKNANGGTSAGSIFTVTVNATPTLTTDGEFSVVCAGSASVSALTYTASSGNATSYAIDWDNAANEAFLSDIPDTLQNFDPDGGKIEIAIPANALPGTYEGLFTLENEFCSSQYPVTITIFPATVGGTVNGGTTITSGNTSGLLTLSGHTGSVVKWQSSVSPFTTWDDIANTNTTYTSEVLTATTQFRAVLQSGDCAVVNSAATTVTVEELPTITGVGAYAVCSSAAAQSTTLYYSETTGSPVTYSIVWDSSPTNSFVAVTDEVLPAGDITIAVPAGTAAGTYFGVLTVKNVNGASSTGSLFIVTVNATPTIVTDGILSETCAGTSSVSALSYSASSGNPTGYAIDWEEDGNDAFLPDIIYGEQTFDPSGGKIEFSIPANALPGTYQGLFTVKSDFCDSEYYPVTITVNPKTVGGTVNGGTTIISGSTSDLLTLSGHTGSVIKWQSSVSPFTTWVDVANTNTTYTSGVLTATTQFRAVVQNGDCAIVNSAPTTVTVEDLPEITAAESANTVCRSNAAQSTTLSYSATTGSPVSYSIVWDSSPANSFAAVTDAALPASPITIAVPAGAAAGTYTGTLTVKNASNVSSAGSLFTVTVNPPPTITTNGTISPVFTSTSSQTTSLAYTAVTGNPTGYSINWDIFSTNSPIDNQGLTPFTFAPGGGVINTIEISPNIPDGTYVGILTIYNETCIVEAVGVTIVVNDAVVPPTITVAESTNTVCSSNDLQGTALSYSATTGSPVSYSIVWDSSPANSFAAVTDAELPASPIKILIPAGTGGGTYTGTLTVKDANGVVSTGSVFTVPINQSPEVTITTTPETSGSLGSIFVENLPEGNSLVAISPGGTIYESNTGSLLIDNLSSGTYLLKIISEQGCDQDVTVGVPYQFFAPEGAKSANNSISIASANKVINVETFNENIDEVLVYDMSGSLLYKKEKIGDSKLVIDNLTNRHQILIVKVVLDNNRTETKKVSY
ncbi:T9SS sorting signal type C domain-containing protein [Flavobacterium pectinovorum]|uniref:Glycine-rich domain-containing protein n=1 Tax=Flavobacterium pectinovorum TaxID=29533 RepID=A0AB36NXH3_9FLAO|nr:T9SS sorting signal type C domain-containing protein [Flavobacterium pectinovorum]OXB02380.1 hypothetical protein B0A72_17175 [Flavobacterium pectinovorum]SHM36619.1 hypothetical protein SAMN05444387_2317 [Flavobacterium pectinovorum]